VGNIVIGTPGSGISFWDRLRGKKGISQRLIEEISGASIIVFDTRKQVEFPDLNSKHKKTINPSQTSEFDHKHPLRSAQVIIWDEFIDWNEAIRELINSISKVQPNLNEDYVWAKINEREQQGATYLKANIRFPHCRIEGIAHPLLVIGIAKAGVLNTYTGDDAKLIILLLSPVDDPNIHLQKIAQLAGFMKDEISVKQLIDSDSVEDAKKILEAWST
jgi:two-component system sensor histidine kinase KdpD